MNAVIIFDVNGDANHNRVVDYMRRLGYHKTWASENKVFTLPHNMIWKPNTELQEAKLDIESAVALLNNPRPRPQSPVEQLMGTGGGGIISGLYGLNPNKIVLRRCIVLSTTPWVGITGTEDEAKLGNVI
jgi:hypothetical protein